MIKICLGVASILIIFTYILNKKSYDFEKLSQYECGIEPFDENISNYNLYNINITETREKFYLKFYIIGIIFLIFDLESILLYPIVFSPVLINNPKIDIFVPMWGGEEIYLGYLIFIIFMFFLIIGLIYEYKKKVLI